MRLCRQLANLASVLASGGAVLAEHLACLGNPSDDPQVLHVFTWKSDVYSERD